MLMAVCGIFLGGCDEKQSSLVGAWFNEEQGFWFEFYEGGAGKGYDGKRKWDAFSWEVKDDLLVILSSSQGGGALQYKISGNKLVVHIGDNKWITYVKEKPEKPSRASKSVFVGTWRHEEQNIHYEFYKDGTGKIKIRDGGIEEVAFSWKTRGDYLIWSFPNNKDVLRYKVIKNRLTFFSADGIFTLVKDEPKKSSSVSKSVPKSAFVGRWISANGSSVKRGFLDNFELYKDGTGIAEKTTISWKVENNRFVVLSTLRGWVYDYEISGNKLTLTDDDGRSETYVKK